MAAIKALEQWCRVHCEGYRDVAITNMTTSFRSGLAFCALIHKYRPDLIDYESLQKEDVFENNRLAFQVAEEKLGIPALLDAEDMVALRIPDRLSILTYVSQYYNYFNGRPPMGGVKRPAEGSREEPSEKKNLPVVARTFGPKAEKNRSPSAHLVTQTPSNMVTAAAAQKAAPAEASDKSGSLNSRCAACRSHVHLVQRHFVEGKLYHRSCFKCSQCSNVLHAGGFKPGTRPDTFVCNAHQKDCKPVGKNGPTGPPAGARKPRPSSVLLAPVLDVAAGVPVGPAPPPEPWTASAQRTQSARQKFFQAAAPADRKRSEVSGVQGRPEIPESREEEEPSRAGRQSGKKLAAENCSNNNNKNKRPFTIRSAGKRFGEEPRSTEMGDRGPAGNGTGRPSTIQPSQKEAPALHRVDMHSSRLSSAKDHSPADQLHESLSDLALPKTGFSQKGDEAKLREHGAAAPVGPVRPPQAPPPSVAPPPPLALFYPACRGPVTAPCRPPPGLDRPPAGECGRSSAKSAPRRPAVEPISAAPESSSANRGTPSGAKKGKYLSPTNASRSEMRSPSQVRSHHVPAEQIEKQLRDIESSLAQLEKDGVELEKRLRHCEEDGDGDLLMDPLMVDWFHLIRRKQAYIRKESELVYTARTQELEQQQPGVEEELRELLEKPDHLKSRVERRREEALMQRLVEIVDGRNAIVEGLDEDRRREEEEDQQLNEMMKSLRVKKPKPKRTSSVSKMFRRRSKRRVE